MARNTRALGRLASAVALGAALLLGAAGAHADPVVGRSLVVGKDVEAGRIHVNGGHVLHVNAQTRFADANGSRITFAQLPVAPQVQPGVWQATGDASIAWEGDRQGDRVVVDHVRVMGVPVE